MPKMLNIQKISSWFYNCGVGTLVPHLLMYLTPDVASLQKFKEKAPSKTKLHHFKDSRGYALFRESFLELYVLDATEKERIINENKFEAVLSNLFETYAKGLEQTMILGPVLRLTLQKLLQKNTTFKNALWPQFTALVHNCAAHLKENPNDTIENYPYQDHEEILFLAHKNRIADFVYILNNEEHPDHIDYYVAFASQSYDNTFLIEWETIYDQFCAHLGSMEQPSFLSVEHLGLLYRSFGFHLSYIMGENSDTVLSVYEKRPKAYLKNITIINRNQNHWELVCQNPESIWEGDTLLDTDHLKMTHDCFFYQSDRNPIKLERSILTLQKGIQDFIKHNINIFVSMVPHAKIMKHCFINNPAYALAYKIDEILFLPERNIDCTILTSKKVFKRFLSDFKSYYKIDKHFDLQALKTLLKAYPNPHERSAILAKALRFKADNREFLKEKNTKNIDSVFRETYNNQFKQHQDAIAKLYNSFGFEVQFSFYETPYEMCNWTTRAEKTYRLPVPLKAIELICLNFNHGEWHAVEPKTLYSVIRNTCLEEFPPLVIEDEETFKHSVKDTDTTSPLILPTRKLFLKAFRKKDLSFTEATNQIPNEFYFKQDGKKNTTFQLTASLDEEHYPFVRAWIQLSALALFRLRAQETHNWINHIKSDFWKKNSEGNTALDIAVKELNFPWIQAFHSILELCEAQATDEWVKEQFRSDIKRLKDTIIQSINSLVTGSSFEEDEEASLEAYFELDLLLDENLSFTPGEHNTFHLARKHKRLDKIIELFEKAVETVLLSKGVPPENIAQSKALFKHAIEYKVFNEYGRNIHFYIETDPEKTKWRSFQNAYDRVSWQWTFSNEMQSTKVSQSHTAMKCIAEIPNNVASKGLLYAAITLAFNSTAGKAQKQVSKGTAYAGAITGITIGHAMDMGASYVSKKSRGHSTYYEEQFKAYGKKIENSSLWYFSTISFSKPSITPTLVSKELGMALDKFAKPAVSDSNYYAQYGEQCGKTIGEASPTVVVSAVPWVLGFQLKLASVALGLTGANVVRHFLPEYKNTQAFFYCFLSDLPSKHNFKSASEDPNYNALINFNNEQFLNHEWASRFSKLLQGIDFVSDQYKALLQGFSGGTVNTLGQIPGLKATAGYIQSASNAFSNHTAVKTILTPARILAKQYQNCIEYSKEALEKQLLMCCVKTEQSKKRLFQLEANRVEHLLQNKKLSEEEIQVIKEKLDLEFQETIGGKALNAWQEEFLQQKELEFRLFRLRQETDPDPSLLTEIQQALDISRARCAQLLCTAQIHTPSHIIQHYMRMKEDIDKKAIEWQEKEIKSDRCVKHYGAQYECLQEAKINLFNIEQNPKSTQAEIQTARDEVHRLSGELDAALAKVKLYTDPDIVNHLLDTTKKLDTHFDKVKANYTKANQKITVFSNTFKVDIDSIFGNFQETRSFYADKATNYILDLINPANDWSPEKRQAEYDRIYKDIHEDVLYSFETRGPQRRQYCKDKLYKYGFQEIKHQRPPLPNKQLGTILKYGVNEALYELFSCEPFQDIAQHTDVAISSQFILTSAIVIGTLGGAAALGVPVSIGVGAGSGGIGLGAAIGPKGSTPDALASFGDDAKGFQKTWNKAESDSYKLKPSNFADNAPFSRPTQSLELPMETLEIEKNEALSRKPALVSSNSPVSASVNFNMYDVIAPVLSSNTKKASDYIPYPVLTPPMKPHTSMETSSNAASQEKMPKEAKPKSSKPQYKKSQSKKTQPKTAKMAKPKLTRAKYQDPNTNKPVVPKTQSAPTAKNTTARLIELNGGTPPKSIQAGAGLSMLVNGTMDAGKSIIEGAGSLVGGALQFSKDVQASGNTALSKKEREAAKKRADKQAEGFFDTCKDLGQALLHPIDTLHNLDEAIEKNLNEVSIEYGECLENGDVWGAGKAGAPIVSTVIQTLAPVPALSVTKPAILFSTTVKTERGVEAFLLARTKNKHSVTKHNTAAKPSHNANNVNAQDPLNRKFSALQGAQKRNDKIRELPDGRIRYYQKERGSKKQGLDTIGSSYVTEFNPKTGTVRSWNECYNRQGDVTLVHPKMLNGQILRGQHYPPIKAELESWARADKMKRKK